MSTPIRMLQLAKHFAPDTGGIETVTLNISETLPAFGIQADVLCTAVGDTYPKIDRGYEVIRCQPDLAFGNKRLSWRYVTQGRRLERDYDVALVHLPNPLAVLVALNWRKPVILLWHADIPQRAIRLATAPLDRRLIAKAAAIISPTPVHVGRSHHAAAIARRKTAVISYPYDLTARSLATGSTPFATRLRAFGKGRALAIAIGRLVPYKGFDVLIEAAKHFGEHLCAVIIGGGPLHDQLADQVRAAGLDDRIMLAGRLSDDELADAFALARMGCLPSVTAAEMYGMVQVETMAAGLPMVSTDIPRSGVPFVNRDGETGLIVAPGDPIALAAALRRLAEDEMLWKRLSEGALRSIAEEHDAHQVAGRYAELIREVVTNRA